MLADSDAISRTRMSPSECPVSADICATLADFAKTEPECRAFDALANLWEFLAQEMAAIARTAGWRSRRLPWTLIG
jgi:hypothetical protein